MAGFPVPPITTAVGAAIGGMLGAAAGAVAVGVTALLRPRADWMVRASLRIIFTAPTLAVVVLSAAVSLSLLWQEVRAPTGYDMERVMVAVFALPVVPAPILMFVAAAWCLEPAFAQFRGPANGRRLFWAALPVPIAIVLLPALFLTLAC